MPQLDVWRVGLRCCREQPEVNHSMPDLPDHYHSEETVEKTMSVGHFFHVLRAYSPVIKLTMAAVLIGYIIVAMTIYLIAPARRVTSLPFRLEFDGADRGEYPNGAKFSSAELISTPVLRAAFTQNRLERFTTFADFSSSVVVLESNLAREALSRDYQARLSDPKLTSVDRERIQREYEMKLTSLSKSEYAIHYLDERRGVVIPPIVVEKVLHDILKEWANLASREQHVLEYRVAVISPEIVAATPVEQSNPIIGTEVLRARIQRVIKNIDQLRDLPSAELIRSSKGELSLVDVEIRLDDIVRFRLEPLIHNLALARLDDRVRTVQFLETQLENDERQLEALKRVAEAARNAMGMYMNGQSEPSAESVLTPQPRQSAAGSETVMPQLSDSFIERLIQLTSSSTDHEFRQKLAERYREAAVAVAPLERATAYDRSVLELMRRAGADGTITRDEADKQIGTTRMEVRQLVDVVHEIYQKISANLNPSTELMRVTAEPSRYTERSIEAKKLALIGVLIWLAALPIVIMTCLLHHRVREEEEVEEQLAEGHPAESAI